jgi:hypothetical protein
MNRRIMMILMSSAWLITSPSLAAECDEDAAADFNSRIEANFATLEGSGTENVAMQEKVEALKQEFSQAGQIHSQALDSGNQADLNEACGRYESILKAQAGLGE